VSADDLTLAVQFLSVLATVANTGDRERLYPFLATDVEWLTPRRDLSGIDEVREELTWITAPENLDLDFEVRQMSDLGGGRVVTDVHELYRAKGTGEVAHTRDRRIELTIRDGKVSRYEMRIVG
jgi:ketosteroid isomerase-like protein